MTLPGGARARERSAGLAIGEGDRVAVTGAAGFIGSAVVRRLLDRGASVVALVEPAGDRQNLRGLDVRIEVADVRDRDAVRRAVDGARFVFHAAALYGFWARHAAHFYDVNVGGTLNVLDAAMATGSERIVFTGTVGTIGLRGTSLQRPATEDGVADISHLFGHYKRSKYVAEHEVLRAAAEGAPVVVVLPTFPLGPRDRRPTPTGKVVVDFLNGRMPGYVDTALNVAHVDDLATGHLLALERGTPGRSYIVGSENLTMRGLLDMLAQVTGLPNVTRRVPRALALAAGAASELVEGIALRRHPSVPLEAARMSTTVMVFDDARARKELGYTSRPAIEAVRDAARWFVDHGYVRHSRYQAIAFDRSRGPGAPAAEAPR